MSVAATHLEVSTGEPLPTGEAAKADGKSSPRRLPLLPVAALLQAQQTLTAVERFSRVHEEGGVPAQAKYYRDLIPLERPRPGEQYAFEVDLDACTGCKACVSACHTLNGLDENEVWRTVGFLHGGTSQAPALQTVTTSCHHCLEPACMSGCPTQAYEKDPVTGIVKHLDDQCFGCQYCTLMCPYDAPKYNKSLGIVRKCDMCSSRLEHGEAPACVQACPNEAIAIRVVERQAAIEASNAQSFLPGAPAPDHTLPSTVYKTERVMPANMLPADFYRTSPEHSHPPLVIMLTLTQLSVGAFALSLLVERLSGHPAGSPLAQTAFACALALVALFASVFHLGRPLLAYRAFLGLRTSWLSREAVAFGVFAKLAILYGVLAAAPALPEFPGRASLLAASGSLQMAAAAVGIMGVFFSVMVYVATRRVQWSGTRTGIKFFGTMLLLGAASVLGVSMATRGAELALGRASDALLVLVFAVTLVKLSFEAAILAQIRDRRLSVERRMAALMLGELRSATALRFGLAIVGGLLLPVAFFVQWIPNSASGPAASAMLAALLGAELSERYLFFRAAPASRMPGGLR
ncbi:MAG TPA: DmsC/YnfH family molybdoenzyme membrane anchor subunit [Polyangiaceae bacterium]|nr:DmsC/YnfH family molybdoenzyme membrane anchor subunit [Polyangiaceae bacterium]